MPLGSSPWEKEGSARSEGSGVLTTAAILCYLIRDSHAEEALQRTIKSE